MRFFLFSIFIIFIFLGCQSNTSSTPVLKKIYSFNNFNYSKEQIAFFEQEFENILNIENPKILEEYTSFYKKNASYFLNGSMKVKRLQEKIDLLNSKKDETLLKLEKAKTKKRKEAIKIYNDLAKEGNIKAQRELVEAYKINHPEIALELLEKLVEQEDIQSMKDYASANIYMIRPVIVQNLEKALATYKKLAQKGELSSIMRLGNIYEYGYHKDIAKQDKKKALKYYELAASKGYLIAQKKLYEIYSCKTCKPNRYHEEKAKKLLAIINSQEGEIKKNNTKVRRKITQQVAQNSIQQPKQKTIKKEFPKKRKAKVIEVAKKKEKIILPIFKTIQCYDMKSTKASLSNSCKQKILDFIENNPKLSKIVISSIISKEEELYFNENLADITLKNPLLKNLVNDRIFEAIWFLKTNLEDDSIIKITTTKITSKKNRGILLKFYEGENTKVKEEVETIAIAPTKEIKLPILKTISCYNMKNAKASLNNSCRQRILNFIENNSKLSKIVIIPVISKEDELYLDKKLINNTFKKALLKNLANDRAFKTIRFLKPNLKDNSIASITTYYVTSQKSAGVILKFY